MPDQIATIAPMTVEHATDVLRIYQAGVDTGDATFDTAPPGWTEWDAAHLPRHRFVAFVGDRVAGWVATSPVSDRCVYAGVVEVSIYVSADARGRGVGTQLMASVIESTEADGVWTLQAGIFPENTASLELHKRAGFRVVGRRERIGQHFGRWRDVLLLERRSTTVGQ